MWGFGRFADRLVADHGRLLSLPMRQFTSHRFIMRLSQLESVYLSKVFEGQPSSRTVQINTIKQLQILLVSTT